MKKILIALLVLIMGACSATEEKKSAKEEFIAQAQGFYNVSGIPLELKADGHMYLQTVKLYIFEQAKNNNQVIYSQPKTPTTPKIYVGFATTGKALKLYKKDTAGDWATMDEVSFEQKNFAGEFEKLPIAGLE